jgi:hypothetical protein
VRIGRAKYPALSPNYYGHLKWAIHKFKMGRSFRKKVMEWFSKKTSIAGVEIPNWAVALAAVVVILLLYSSMR